MDFKEQVAADISAVFLNTTEFADTHDINGTPTDCVIDENQSIRRGTRQNESYDGIYTRRIVIYVAEEDIGYRPERDQKFVLDGETYMVIDCNSDAGILEIELGANRP